MSREKIISQVKQGIKKRFMKLSEEEKNIIRENKNTPYSMLIKEVLGDELLSGLINTDGKQLLNKGGRVGYAYGSGLKLIKILKQKGTSLKKAIDDAVNNVFPTGDKKLDADMIVDDMLETYNIDRDAVDGYDILDAYGLAYKKITSPKVSSSIDISDPKTASDFAKFAKENDPEGYKKIEKIVEDINNKKTLENFDVTGRKKNASGGLAYLMGL